MRLVAARRSPALLALTFLLSVVPARPQTYIFNRAVLPAQQRPTAVAAADLDGDGDVDLLAANTRSNTVSVFRNSGDGTFSPQPLLKTGGGPSAMAVADFNGDGKMDLAVANANVNTFSVFLGKGDASFAPPETFTAGLFPVSIIAADFNGDRKIDLAVANQNGATITIAIGKGDGSFQHGTDIVTDGTPSRLVAGDFNADGKTDLAVLRTSDVLLYLANGDGTFTQGVSLDASPRPVAFTTGDWNQDGRLDLAIGNGTGGNYRILLFLGNGDGTFGSPASFGSGESVLDLAAADVTGDGKPDLVSSTIQCPGAACGMGGLVVYAGDGKGSLTVQQNLTPTIAASRIQLADLNGDGKLDIMGSYSANNQLGLYINQGTGNFFSTASYPAGSTPEELAAGDFDEDGSSDVVVLNGNAGRVTILLNNGDGTFRSGGTVSYGQGGDTVTVADLNGDHHLDLVVANGTVAVLLGNGNGTFQPAVIYSVPGAFIVLTGDFNGDGILDIACDVGNQINVLPGKGDGTFGSAIVSATQDGALGFAVGDFDGDGILDAVLDYEFSTRVDLFHGNGDATFTLSATYTGVGSANYYIRTSDFDRDGNLDFVVANNSFPQQLIFFFGNGDGTARGPYSRSVRGVALGLAVPDWNQDGYPDVAATGGLALLLGKGNGTFAEEFDVPAVGDYIAVADFLGQGGLDLATLGGEFLSITLNQPVMALSSNRLDFSNQKVGTQSQPITVKISNPGTVPIAISSITITGDFIQTSTCGSSLPIRGSCVVNVVFAPTQKGARTGTLTLNDKVPGSPQLVSLSGTGV